MKYWIFQNNQVLGPYEPEELRKTASLTPESLVCSEGRRGTSMGDWQRAGMVADLSFVMGQAKVEDSAAAVAAVTTVEAVGSETSKSQQAPAAIATVEPVKREAVQPEQKAALPLAAPAPQAEPSSKDLAILNGVQDKIASLESMLLRMQEGLRSKDNELADLRHELNGREKSAALEAVILQMQEGMRSKDSELAALRQELNGKARETGNILNEALDRQRETDAIKRQMSTLEERLSSLKLLSETLDKAVEEERRVEQDVEKQGQTISALTREIESLSLQLRERAVAPAAAAPNPVEIEFLEDSPPPVVEKSSPAPDFIQIAPAPVSAPVPAPDSSPSQDLAFREPPRIEISAETEPQMETPPVIISGDLAEPELSSPEPTTPMPLELPPSTIATTPPETVPPVAFDNPRQTEFEPPPVEVAQPPSLGALPLDVEPARKRSYAIALLLGVLVCGSAVALVLMRGGYFPRAPELPDEAASLTPVPLPPPQAPTPDQRQSAVEFAKSWMLEDGKSLAQTLTNLAPAGGNLSPWMAETLTEDRVQVNYFARGSSADSPTIAYEFEVNLADRTLVGRNVAAKVILAGKVAAPPPPPAAKPVKVKPKTIPPPPPQETNDPLTPDPLPSEESLHSLAPGDDDAAAENEPVDNELSSESSIMPPGGDEDRPAKLEVRRSPSSASSNKNGAKSATPAADESLLDDILKE
ncbi:MAG: GYF domain-containing protein [Elusimicrobiota bacterium]